jgi:formylglycine-generating enzyme required for sulfatase activity
MKFVDRAIFPVLAATALVCAANVIPAERPKPSKEAPSQAAENLPKIKTYTVKGVAFNMCLIPPGTFVMGAPETEDGREDDEVQHQVTISRPFYMMETEVTLELYEAVMGSLPAGVKDTPKTAPVQMVAWARANDFCRRLSQILGVECRLPTEAEWEYACRAGTKTAYYWGDKIDGDYAWYFGNSGGRTQPVKQKKPNAFGLYDMSGNVWEWCADIYRPYPTHAVVDPKCDEVKGKYGPVFRGGGFGLAFGEKNDERYLRSAERNMFTGPAMDIGFRTCLTASSRE